MTAATNTESRSSSHSSTHSSHLVPSTTPSAGTNSPIGFSAADEPFSCTPKASEALPPACKFQPRVNIAEHMGLPFTALPSAFSSSGQPSQAQCLSTSAHVESEHYKLPLLRTYAAPSTTPDVAELLARPSPRHGFRHLLANPRPVNSAFEETQRMERAAVFEEVKRELRVGT